jgi:hypothetical protein
MRRAGSCIQNWLPRKEEEEDRSKQKLEGPWTTLRRKKKELKL